MDVGIGPQAVGESEGVSEGRGESTRRRLPAAPVKHEDGGEDGEVVCGQAQCVIMGLSAGAVSISIRSGSLFQVRGERGKRLGGSQREWKNSEQRSENLCAEMHDKWIATDRDGVERGWMRMDET